MKSKERIIDVFLYKYIKQGNMKDYLKIDLYSDGLDTNQLNCIDIPIAAASGYFNYDNYFFYCFYHCILNNWSDIKNEDWLSLRNRILNKLGLTLKPIDQKNTDSLIQVIKSEIDKKHPLLLLVKYYTLFYHEGYLDDKFRHMNHGMLVNGYDPEKSLICIKEYSHIENDIKSLNKSYLFCDLVLPENIIIDIWTKSVEIFQEESENESIIYSIESINKPQISNYNELIDDFLRSVDLKSDNFIDFIKNFNNIYMNLNNMRDTIHLRKNYVNSLSILFNVFERSFSFLQQDLELNMKYENMKDKYFQTRSLIFNKLIANALRRKTIDKDTERNLIDQIISINNELFTFIFNIQENRVNFEKNSSIHIFTLANQGQVKDGQYADVNVKSSKLLIVQEFPQPDRNWEMYLKFDLKDLEMTKCSSAILKLFCSYCEGTPVEVYYVKDNCWSDSEITWSNKPAVDAEISAFQVLRSQNAWCSFDVTTLINNKILDNKIISFCIKVKPGSFAGAYFYNKHTFNKQPVLEVISADHV